MYEKHFGLVSDPFRLSPSSRPCFEHKTYRRAMAYLSFALRRRDGVLMLTGTPGTGKTSIIRQFASGVVDPDIAIEQIVCSALDAEDVLRATALKFGITPEGLRKSELYEKLAARFASMWEHGKRPVLIFDEAQGLTLDALEEVRALTNLVHGDEALLQVFLVGQPSLAHRVRSPGLEQLHQRLIVACRLQPLDEHEIRNYVAHCFSTCGHEGDLPFTEDVYSLVHGESFGIPRRINLIMSRLLLHGLARDINLINGESTVGVLEGLRKEGLLSSQSWKSAAMQESDDDDEENRT